MNDYLVMPIIFVMILLFFFNYMIIDGKFHKEEMRVDRKFTESERRDIDLKYKLESMERKLDRIQDDIRRK